MTGHELILVDAMQQHVHDGPLRSDFLPAPVGLCFGQGDGRGASQVDVQAATLNIHAAPDHFAGLAYALERAAAEAEIHRWLALAYRAFVAANQVRGRYCPRNLEQPYELVDSSGRVLLAPAHIVQGRS